MTLVTVRRYPSWCCAIALFLFAGCADDRSGPGPPTADAGPIVKTLELGVVAAWPDGSISLNDLDRALLSSPAAERMPAGLDDATRVEWLERRVLEIFARRHLVASEAMHRLEEEPEFVDAWAQRRRDVLARAYLARRNEPFEVTVEEARQLFEQRYDAIAQPERRAFRHLFVAAAAANPGDDPTSSVDAACAEAEGLLARARAGESFDDLVRAHSDSAAAALGGQIGPIARSALRGEMADIVFALEAGEISDVVRARTGCHLFKLEHFVPALEPRFELMQDELVRALAEQRRGDWRREQMRTLALDRGIELPKWIEPEVAAPTAAELAESPEAVVVDLGVRQITARDLVTRLRDGTTPGGTLAGMVQSTLFSAAAEAELEPDPLDALLAPERNTLAFRMLANRQLEEWVRRDHGDVLLQHYEEKRQRFVTDPELELTHVSWPVPPGDPLDALARPEALAASLRAGQTFEEIWPQFADDPGVVRQIVPRTSERELAVSRPVLAPLLAEEATEGQVVGPYRFGRSLHVVRVDLRIPERQLNYLEAESRVLSDYLSGHRDALLGEWLGRLAAEVGVAVDRDALRDFGLRLLAASADPGETMAIQGESDPSP